MRPRSRRSKRSTAPGGQAEEELRLRYLYHDLVLRGKVRISLETAKRLIGPDRAYHLYGGTRDRTRGQR